MSEPLPADRPDGPGGPVGAPVIGAAAAMDIVLITGMSGSGKSVALHALEDAGYYCVDNLPPDLLLSFVALEQRHGATRVGIAMDVRSAASLPLVPQQLAVLRAQGIRLQMLFLDAQTDTLVRRYSETRRRHPLSSDTIADRQRALTQAIELERELLADLREEAHVLDSSLMRASQLQGYVKSLVAVAATPLLLVFQSFAFKRGIPVDADFVFDVRMLPNPHYEASLRPLTGRDAPVAEFLQKEPAVERMFDDIGQFLARWLDTLAQDHRSYVTVGIGCTGGQHRSVYLVERLAASFAGRWVTLKRHRELDAQT
ncbi:RNase adapter RapZ [Sphingomonas sp. NCPPB 2930]